MIAGFERAILTDPGVLGTVGLVRDSRLPGVPAWTASAAATYHHAFNDVEGSIGVDGSYTGVSTSLVNASGGLIATRAAYALVNVQAALARGPSTLSLAIHNVGNRHPNLGDVGYNGYAQTSAQGVVLPQVMTLAPLTVALQARRQF